MAKVNQQLLILMLKPVLIVRLQRKQQLHRKEIVVIEMHVLVVEKIEIEHVVLMVLHRKRIEKIELLLHQQQRKRRIPKVTKAIKITMDIIVSIHRSSERLSDVFL